MHYRVLRELRRVEARLEQLHGDGILDGEDIEGIRAFRLYLEQLDPELFAEIECTVAEITEAVELGLSGDPQDYETALGLLEATALLNDLRAPDEE